MDWRAWFSTVALSTIAAIAAGTAACEADLESDCTSGPCGGATVGSGATVSAASTGEGGGAPGCLFPDTGEIPCDVYTVLNARCHKCHQDPPGNGAPFPLLTWDDFQYVYGAKPVWQRADVAIEPGAIPQMPFLEDPLPEEQRAVLHAWFDTCEAGECEKAPDGGSGGAAGTGGAGGQGGSGSGGAPGTGGAGGG